MGKAPPGLGLRQCNGRQLLYWLYWASRIQTVDDIDPASPIYIYTLHVIYYNYYIIPTVLVCEVMQDFYHRQKRWVSTLAVFVLLLLFGQRALPRPPETPYPAFSSVRCATY